MGRLLGFGLCIDSCHPDRQGRIVPSEWADAIAIIDEVEQVISHMLSAATCRLDAVKILLP